MTRFTVNLTAKATDEMAVLMAKTGMGKTDTMNRALLVYGFVERIADAGGRLMIVHEDGTQERICLL